MCIVRPPTKRVTGYEEKCSPSKKFLASAKAIICPVHNSSPGTQMTLPYMTGVIVFHQYPPALRPQALCLEAVFVEKDTTKRGHVIKPKSAGVRVRHSRCFHGNTAGSWTHVHNVKRHWRNFDWNDEWHRRRCEWSEVCIIMQGRIS